MFLSVSVTSAGEKYLDNSIYKDIERITANNDYRLSRITVDILGFPIQSAAQPLKAPIERLGLVFASCQVPIIRDACEQWRKIADRL